MNQVARYQSPEQLIVAQQTQFESIAPKDISFAKESQFAIQLMQGNAYLAKVAMQNQDSMIAAVRNVAAIGVSLNPAAKHAYLVPRGGKVVLDLSYMGLMDIATQSGSVLWVQCVIVHEKDRYIVNGIDKAPTHEYNPFSNRGEIVGAYCVAKTHDGAFLTEAMPIKDIHNIRARSESFKKGGMSPWKTDEGEMIRKTVIKRAYKYWPKTERMTAAVEMLNQQEGIDFKSERAAARDVTPVDDQVIQDIRMALDILGRPEAAALAHFSSTIFMRGVNDLSELTAVEAGKMKDMLNQMVDAKVVKEQQQQGEVF
ncbi:MAG: recombinase RecT [Plesiomonas shigelloides]